MAAIPEPIHQHSTARAIFRLYEEREAKQKPRPYLGASIIGRPCDRELWYTFRQVALVRFEGRMLRLFDTGHREEARFVEELRGIGCEVLDVDPETGEQWEVSAVNGHFSGHADGVAKGLPEAPKKWALLEFKTHNAKSFARLIAEGVEKSKPEHWAQMHIYGHLLGLDRALYLACSKDTDDLHAEWVHIDKSVAERFLARAERIIYATHPPARLSDDPAHWQCKFCGFYDVCHQDAPPRKNCRTCVHATPCKDRDGGKWVCSAPGAGDAEIPIDVQLTGCPEHLFIPPLLQYAEPVDAGTGWVAYQHRATGKGFLNIAASADRETMPELVDAEFTSDELAIASPAVVADEFVRDLKAEFPGARVVADDRVTTSTG